MSAGGDGSSLGAGSSFDPNSKLFGRIRRKKIDRRFSSNCMDRFGRIAFNKNRELSQASLDVDKAENSVSDEGDESN